MASLRTSEQDIDVRAVDGVTGFVEPQPSSDPTQYAYFNTQTPEGKTIDRHSMVPQDPEAGVSPFPPAGTIFDSSLYSGSPDESNPVAMNHAQHDILGPVSGMSRDASSIFAESEVTSAQLKSLMSGVTPATREDALKRLGARLDATMDPNAGNVVTSGSADSVSFTTSGAEFFNNEEADWDNNSELKLCLDDCGRARGDLFHCASSCYSESR